MSLQRRWLSWRRARGSDYARLRLTDQVYAPCGHWSDYRTRSQRAHRRRGRRIHLVVGYQASRVRSHFGPTYRDVQITYHTQQNQLGSGHALLQARDGPEGSFLLVNGDQIIDHRIVEAVSDAHSTAATLAVVEGPQAPNYGAVHLSGDTITELIEQPKSGEYRLFNAGVYAFTEQIFETLETLSVERGKLPLTDAIQELIATEDTHVNGVHTEHFWMNATHPWDLLSRELLARGWVDTLAISTDSDIY